MAELHKIRHKDQALSSGSESRSALSCINVVRHQANVWALNRVCALLPLSRYPGCAQSAWQTWNCCATHQCELLWGYAKCSKITATRVIICGYRLHDFVCVTCFSSQILSFFFSLLNYLLSFSIHISHYSGLPEVDLSRFHLTYPGYISWQWHVLKFRKPQHSLLLHLWLYLSVQLLEREIEIQIFFAWGLLPNWLTTVFWDKCYMGNSGPN